MEALGGAEITQLLDLGERFLEIAERPIKKVPTLRGKTVINLFFEASTRTRTSFEIAGQAACRPTRSTSRARRRRRSRGRWPARHCPQNLDAMAPDVVVVRHARAGAAEMLAARLGGWGGQRRRRCARAPDASAARLLDDPRAQGRIDGVAVVICGDIRHSRVARSDIWALTKPGPGRPHRGASHRRWRLGSRAMRCACRPSIHERLEPALEGADVIMMLRIQKERIGGALFFPTPASTSATSPSTRAAGAGQARRHRHALRGPFNRGIEIDPGRSPTARAPSSSTRSRAVSPFVWPSSTCSPAARRLRPASRSVLSIGAGRLYSSAPWPRCAMSSSPTPGCCWSGSTPGCARGHGASLRGEPQSVPAAPARLPPTPTLIPYEEDQSLAALGIALTNLRWGVTRTAAELTPAEIARGRVISTRKIADWHPLAGPRGLACIGCTSVHRRRRAPAWKPEVIDGAGLRGAEPQRPKRQPSRVRPQADLVRAGCGPSSTG